MRPDVSAANARESPRQTGAPLVGKRLKLIGGLVLAAVLTVVGGYHWYCGPREKVEQSVDESLRQPVRQPRNFPEIPEGTVLLDLADKSFEPVPVRIRGIVDKKREEIMFTLLPGPKGKGPVIRVEGNLFSVANKPPMGGKRMSQHVHKILKGKQGIVLHSNTPVFENSEAVVLGGDLFHAVRRLREEAGSCTVSLGCTVLLNEDCDPSYPIISLEFERENPPGSSAIRGSIRGE